MRWEPITPENVVAKLSVASEHAICDFKFKYDTGKESVSFEIAKDVCAFANYFGGTIVVGAHEGQGAREGLIGAFAPLIDPTPPQLIKKVERALRMYCSPQPSANAIPIALSAPQVEQILGRPGKPATTIVAINVEPGFNTPYGCRTCSYECEICEDAGSECSCEGKEIEDAYRFPIRFIEGTRFLRPDELAKTMNVTERRAMLELQAIQGETSINVWFNSGTHHQRIKTPCTITSIDHEIMVAMLQLVQFPTCKAEIPLVFVRAVWRSSDGWNIAIDGSAFDGAGANRTGFRPIGSSAS